MGGEGESGTILRGCWKNLGLVLGGPGKPVGYIRHRALGARSGVLEGPCGFVGPLVD